MNIKDYPIDPTNKMHKDYEGCPNGISQGSPFQEWDVISYGTVKILHELYGLPWDDFALAYVHSARPSHIRVIESGDGVQMDSRLWRVNVFLNKDKVINYIEQEVKIGCMVDPNGNRMDGHEMRVALEERHKQLDWARAIKLLKVLNNEAHLQ